MKKQELDELLDFLAATPAAVTELAGDLADEELRWKPSEEEFSLVENACHLRDIEREGYTVRIERLLNEREPFLADLDGSRLAVERRYNEQDAQSAVASFTDARLMNVSRLRGLSMEELGRSGTMENAGHVTLEKLLSMMREHDEAHREEMVNLRARMESRE